MGLFDNFQLPPNLLNFLPSEQELQIAKATRDAQAMQRMQADTNPIRRAPFMAATAMGMNPTLASGIPTAIDFAPVTGELSAAVDAKQAYDKGDFAKAGLLAGAVALPFVPASAYKAAGKTAMGLLDNIDPNAVGSMGGNIFAGRRGIGGNNPPPNMNIDPLASVDLPPGSDPSYIGAATNRTEPYPRYRPVKTTDRMQRLTDTIADENNKINTVFDSYIEKGKKLGGPDWYNTEELRDWMTGTLGEVEGDRQWREFIELIGTTSTGSKVPQNIRMASFYRALSEADRASVAQIVKEERITPLAAATKLGVVPNKSPTDYAYGHIKQGNQAGNVINREAGLWDREVPGDLTGAALSKRLQANPKVKGFGNDLLGDDTNIAADMHFMRMHGMADGGGDFLNAQAKLSADNAKIVSDIIGPRRVKKYTSSRKVNGKVVSEINLFKAWKDGHIKDTSPFQKMPTAWADTPKANEYAAYEDMAGRVAQKYDMTPAQFQASLWMGAGDMTGLADESQGTFMELFRRGLDKRASELGVTRKEMLEDFIVNKVPLAVVLSAGAGATQLRNENQQPQGLLF